MVRPDGAVSHHEAGAPLFGPDLPLVEKPSARVRCIARLFCSEQEDKSWFHDRQFWHDAWAGTRLVSSPPLSR